MPLEVITPTVFEVVSLAQAKAHLRQDSSADDAVIADMLRAAHEQCELEARRSFLTQTLKLTLDAWPPRDYIALPRPPLQSVSSVAYVKSDGTSATVSSSTYTVETVGDPGRIVLGYGQSWPSDELRPGYSITITYVAGYTPDTLPARYRHATLLLLGHYYENRESVVVGQGYSVVAVPDTVSRLLSTSRGRYF